MRWDVDTHVNTFDSDVVARDSDLADAGLVTSDSVNGPLRTCLLVGDCQVVGGDGAKCVVRE